MIILHAVYQNAGFSVWAEQSFSLKKVSKKHKGNHPFQVDKTDLNKILKSLYVETPSHTTLPLTLPTIQPLGIPLPSSRILCSDDDELAGGLEDGLMTLTSWNVTAVQPNSTGITKLFREHASNHMIYPGVFIGPDFHFWGKVFEFVALLVKNQQVVPSMIQTGSKEKPIYRGVWRGVFEYQTETRIQELLKIMPSACLGLEQGDSPTSPEYLLKEVIHSLVDKIVRASISQAQLLPHLSKTKIPTMHDAWLLSLCLKDNQITHGAPKDQQALLEDVSLWQARSVKTVQSGCRICLEIEDPDVRKTSEDEIRIPSTHKDLWPITLTLQSTTDPSLRVPLKDVWDNPSAYTLLHHQSDKSLREFLLKSLSHISDHTPSLSPFLEQLDSIPKTFLIPTEVAFSFLQEEASSLMQEGFGVFLPSRWQRIKSPLKASVSAKSSMQGKGKLSLEELIHFEWQISLLDKTVSQEELNALADLKTPLVQVRGEWVMLSPEDIQKALKMYQEPQSMGAQGFLKMALTGSHAPISGGIPITKVSATGWLGNLIQDLTAEKTYEDVEVDTHFKGSLRPYQQSGMGWLSNLKNWGMGACLADDMGLGKTVQTLAFIQKDLKKHGGKVLLICPTSVIGNWEKEASKFTPNLRVSGYHGLKRSKGKEFKTFMENQDVIITSYALLQRDVETLKTIPWHGVILDEAQNIKNAATKQFKAVKSLNPLYRIALTGTPVENNVGDLWALMDFLNPGLLGSQKKFKETFFTPIQSNRDPETIRTLKALTSPFILRRLKTDKTIIKALPDKIETKVYSHLTKEQASLYKAVTDKALKAIDEAAGDSIERKGLVLGMLTTLKQICNHPAHFLKDNSEIGIRSGKLERLTEMITEIMQSKDKILIFTQFTEMGHMLKSHLQEQFGEEVLFLHGAVSKEKRDQMVERFQSSPTPSIFILSLKAGGTGLTLTAANHVFHFDRWWNPAVEDQASDRAFRIGQTKTVQVHKFVCKGTLEEKIDELIEDKKSLAASIVGTGEGWVSQLSTDALKEMVTLRETALMN